LRAGDVAVMNQPIVFDVRVESTLGVGTRVTVELPSRDRAA
jgi:hypothetical protein